MTTKPLSGGDSVLTERATRSLDRLREMMRVSELPAGLGALAQSENAINDIYMNLNRQLQDGTVEQRTKLLVALGVAVACGSSRTADFFSHAAQAAGRTREEVLDAIAVATTCTIFNGYYRFRSQVPGDLAEAFEAFRAPFNANSFVKSVLPPLEVEAICIAVSSANNCKKCVEGHLAKGRSLGLTDEQVDEIIKAGAVAQAAAQAIAALTPPAVS